MRASLGTIPIDVAIVENQPGRDDEVTFIDGSGGSDGKYVRVIKKKIEIAQ